jgi:glycerol kinase
VPTAASCASETIDTWLIAKLTGRHGTDVTNASRTLVMNLSTLDWDSELLDALGVPRAMLPEILPSSFMYGEARGDLAGVPIAAALGDQPAALFGQTCFAPGDANDLPGRGLRGGPGRGLLVRCKRTERPLAG